MPAFRRRTMAPENLNIFSSTTEDQARATASRLHPLVGGPVLSCSLFPSGAGSGSIPLAPHISASS
jgi:hypothetical protein